MTVPAIKICATCRRVLDYHDHGGGNGTYQHTLLDASQAHEADPVDPQPGQTRGRCDFCSAENPRYRLPVRNFALPGGYASDGDWAACPDCALLIASAQWGKLLGHATAAHAARTGQPLSPGEHAALAMMYEGIRANVTGSLRIAAEA